MTPADSGRRRYPASASHLRLPASAWPRGQVYYFCPSCTAVHALGRRRSGDLPGVRAAPVAPYLRRDGGAPGAGVRVLRRHPQRASSMAVYPRAGRKGAPVVHLQHGPRRLRRVARPRFHAAAAAALEFGRGSAGRLDRRHPGAPRPGHQPAAGPRGRRHHRRRRGIPRALRLLGIRVATAQPGVHGRPLPAAGRGAVQPRLPRHGRPGTPLAGGDLGRAPAVDRRKLDLARGGDPPGLAGARQPRAARATARAAPLPRDRTRQPAHNRRMP